MLPSTTSIDSRGASAMTAPFQIALVMSSSFRVALTIHLDPQKLHEVSPYASTAYEYMDGVQRQRSPKERFEMSRLQRVLIAIFCPAALSLAPVLQAHAQNFPTAPVRIVAPYPPGGGTDILSRAIAQKLTERHAQPAIVDNRAGANGTIGAAYVAKAPPDGHTALLVP